MSLLELKTLNETFLAEAWEKTLLQPCWKVSLNMWDGFPIAA